MAGSRSYFDEIITSIIISRFQSQSCRFVDFAAFCLHRNVFIPRDLESCLSYVIPSRLCSCHVAYSFPLIPFRDYARNIANFHRLIRSCHRLSKSFSVYHVRTRLDSHSRHAAFFSTVYLPRFAQIKKCGNLTRTLDITLHQLYIWYVVLHLVTVTIYI